MKKAFLAIILLALLAGCNSPRVVVTEEVHTVFLPAVPNAGNQPIKGVFCSSCGSEACRAACRGTIAVGVENRFAWCEIEPERGVYDFPQIERWLRVNADLGLKSAIGIYPRTTRGGETGGACTASSDGSPVWALTTEYNPLLNSGYALLNFLDPGIKQARAELPGAMLAWYKTLPDDLRQNIDHIEIAVARDGELTPANSAYGDLYRYQCNAGGGYWIDGSGTCTGNYSAGQAAARWRDEVIKPAVDAWGSAWIGVEPVALNIVGQMVYPGMERAQPCADCGGLNIIDYARTKWDMGLRISNLTPDFGNGQGRDTTGEAYVNTANALTLNRDGWVLGEYGTMYADGRQCCKTPADLYWAMLNAADKRLDQAHFIAPDLTLTGREASEARDLLVPILGVQPADSDLAGIAFRDTGGTYYPDGDNGAPRGGPPPCCREEPNYEFGITQSNPTTAQLARTGLPASWINPVYSSARTTAAGSLTMNIDDNWRWNHCTDFDAEVIYLNGGGDTFALEWRAAAGWQTATVAKTSWPIEWRAAHIPITPAPNAARDDLRLSGNGDGIDTFHRLIIRPANECTPEIPPQN